MLYWAIVCAIAALIFGLLGFTGIAAGFATIARFLLALFLILLVIFLVLGRGCVVATRPAPRTWLHSPPYISDTSGPVTLS